MRYTSRLIGPLAVLALASAVSAHEVKYAATLSGPNESPANASAGTGSVLVTVDLDLATMRVEANFTGLDGTTTASHIHAPTLVAGQSTAGVATMTPSFVGFPLGVKAGTYDHTFDLSLTSTYNAPFVTANGNSASGAMNALIGAMDAGKAYFNIHTSTFGGGEIRGFLAVVPEPTTATACIAGVAMLASRTRRRR